MEEQRFAMRAIADHEAEITRLNDLDLEACREQIECAARIYDERARHAASCRSEVARGKVDRQLRPVFEKQLLPFLEDLARRRDVGI